MLRRRDLMSTAKASGGGFVFPDVDACWVEKWVFRTQDGLVSARNSASDAYNVVAYLNLSNPKQNTKDAHTTDNVCNKPAIFTIPAGAECELTMTGFFSTQAGYSYIRAALYEALSTNVIANTPWTPNYHQGNYTVSKTWTQANEVSVGSVALVASHVLFCSNYSNCNNTDITLTVNGERWI